MSRRNRRPGRTRWLAATAASAALICLTGCGSSGSSGGLPTSPEVDPCTQTNLVGPPPPTSVCPNGVDSAAAGSASGPVIPSDGGAPATADEQTSAPVKLETASFTLKLGDGTTIEGRLRLSHILPAGSDVNAAWSSVSDDSSSPPCDADDSRDGVILGTIAFTNQTPAYAPNLDLQFQDGAGGVVTHSLGVGYSSDPECDDFSQYPNHGDIKPAFQSTDWGPVPIEIVIQNYYSPGNPDGDSSLLGEQSLDFIALNTGGTGGFYDTTTTSGLLEPTHINGVVFVRLRKLASF